MQIKKTSFTGIWFYNKGRNKIFLTKNLTPNQDVYGEKLINIKGTQYREWNPKRSKLCAAMARGLKELPIKKSSTILYLGSAYGTTVSHLSDILINGYIFGLDFAPRMVRDFVFLAEKRKNIIPLLEDANKPKEYIDKVTLADFVFQDISQRNQAEIFLKNIKYFLKDKGYGMIAVKARCIDVSRKPRDIFREVRRELSKEVNIIEEINLDPFEVDHTLFLIQKRN